MANNNKISLELKVGIFIFIGLIILGIFIFLIGNFQFIQPSYNLKLIFSYVNGLKVGAPVRLAGVDVGEVKDLHISFDKENQKTLIEVTTFVRRYAKVPVDSEAWINTLGLLGEKYVEIIPGKNYDSLMKENDILIGIDPIPMQEVMKQANDLVVKLEDILGQVKSGQGTIGRLIYDDTVYKNLEEFSTDIKAHPWKLLFKGKEKKVAK
ncbi:MAG: MlaD family protein [Candidatus Omnitrophota bacterium]